MQRKLIGLLFAIIVTLAPIAVQAGSSGITPPVLRVKSCKIVRNVRTCTWVVVAVRR